MLKPIKYLLAALLLASTAQAFSVSPPTVFQSWNDPLTVNEQMASVTVNTIGLNRLKLSEAPGSSADVTVEFFLEDGVTSVQRIDFANDDTTADIDSQIQVITKKAVIYITPRVTNTYTACVYGVAGGDTNTANTDASILTTGTLPSTAIPSNVVTDSYTTAVVLNAGQGDIDTTIKSVNSATAFVADASDDSLSSSGKGLTITSISAGSASGVTINDGGGRITVLKSPGVGSGMVGTTTGQPFDIISAGTIHAHIDEFGSAGQASWGITNNIQTADTGTTLNTPLAIFSTSTTPDPTESRMFYNLTHKALSIFNGTKWITLTNEN